MPRIVVRERAAESARRGHPWIYREAIRGNAPTGTVVRAVSEGGSDLGLALYDAESPIALRIWGGHGASFEELVRARIEAALSRRRALFKNEATTAFRLLHGEGDRTPGFVLDRYGETIVLKTDGAAALARRDDFVQTAWPLLRCPEMRNLIARKTGSHDIEVLEGELASNVLVREHGMTMKVDLEHGQKTGAFLDQRENRRRVRAMAEGKSVLNLFSYAGGFSLAAALGGATKVTSVDIAAQAHKTAQDSFKTNGLEPRGHEFVTADVFAFLESAKRGARTFDLVISDPPSFAPNERAKARALIAYRKLHRACTEVLTTGGTFCAASCSSHVSMADFLSTLDDSALARELSVVSCFGPPEDHPVLAAFPEGAYLKFVELR